MLFGVLVDGDPGIDLGIANDCDVNNILDFCTLGEAAFDTFFNGELATRFDGMLDELDGLESNLPECTLPLSRFSAESDGEDDDSGNFAHNS